MAKRYYKVKEHVWIKTLKKKGVVQSLDIPNLQADITYFLNNGELVCDTFKFTDIDKLRTDTKENKNTKPLTILVKYFDDELPKIEQIEKGNWIDLRSAVDVDMVKGEHKLIPLGVAMSLPFGYEAHVRPRSSTFKNWGIIPANCEGIIDETYRGNDDQWFFSALAMRDTSIKKGDRICQFRIVEAMPKLNIVTVDALKSENRGGHGSTGKN